MGRILLVDDERDVITLVQFMLEREGHSIVAAYNGVEALAKAGVEPRGEGEGPFDLVLLDVMMPIVDGETVCRRLSEDPRTRSVPVIVLTARGELDGMARPPNVAASLEKPFDPKALRELVAKTLRRP